MKTNAHYLLEKIYKDNRNNYAAAAYFLGLPNSRSIEYYIKKQREIPASLYELMLVKCPEVSAEWLMRGEGTFEREPIMASERTPLVDQDDLMDILITNDSKKRELCKHYTTPIKCDYLMTIHTDEMQQTYPKGCILALRVVKNEYIQWGRAYALLTNQGFLFRRVEKSKRDGAILLVADNEKYAPMDVQQKIIIGKALIVGKLEME